MCQCYSITNLTKREFYLFGTHNDQSLFTIADNFLKKCIRRYKWDINKDIIQLTNDKRTIMFIYRKETNEWIDLHNHRNFEFLYESDSSDSSE